MSTTPSTTYRFSLAKDLKDWIDITGQKPWGDLTGSDEQIWTYEYLGDRKFLPYMSLYTSEIEQFSKYFPDMDLWLKNIYWDDIFTSAEAVLKQILSESREKPTFSLLHLFPLEMAIVGEAVKSLGGVHVVYNINRIPAINSISKTLEASLFLISWKHIDWLKERMDRLVSHFQEQFPNRKLADHFFLFDENDTTPNWNIAHIDSYVKGAIGFKESIITYRAEEFPSKEFLTNNGYRSVMLYDTDNSHAIDEYYKQTLGDAFDIKQKKLEIHASERIGYYEDYVVEKNTEYLRYRKDVLQTVNKNKIQMKNSGGTEKWKNNYSGGSTQVFTNTPITLKEGLVYLGGLAILLPIFIMLATSNGKNPFPILSSVSGGKIGGSSSSSIGGSSSSWGSSFSSSSKSSSSSSISSFGGGGFSKGGG